MKTFDYGSELIIVDTPLYPVLLNTAEIAVILDKFISRLNDPTYLKAYIRKTLSKGIEYKVLMSNKPIKDATTPPTNNEYSIVIHPNWHIDILEHYWTMNSTARCQKLEAESLSKFIQEIILKKKKQLDLTEINPVFKNEDWVLLRDIKDVILI